MDTEIRQKISLTKAQLSKIQNQISDEYRSVASLNAGLAFQIRKEDIKAANLKMIEGTRMNDATGCALPRSRAP
jgi:hypothetical protein